MVWDRGREWTGRGGTGQDRMRQDGPGRDRTEQNRIKEKDGIIVYYRSWISTELWLIVKYFNYEIY